MRLTSLKRLGPALSLLVLACSAEPTTDSTSTGGHAGTDAGVGATGGTPGASGGAGGAAGGTTGTGGTGGVSSGGTSGTSGAGGGGHDGSSGGAGGGSGAGGGGHAGSAAGAGGGGGHGGATGGGGGHAGASAGTGGVAGGGGGSSVQFPPGCTCLGLGPPACTPTGHVTYTLAVSASPTADEQAADKLITCAMDAAVAYYNCNTTITKQLNVSYVPTVQTADGNINGSIRFGQTQYMECATGMHETAHAVGIGTATQWSTYSVGGVFTGPIAIAQLHAIPGHATDTLYSDTQHFWPFGLNQASEAMSPADLVDHCLMVTAIRKDMGLQ